MADLKRKATASSKYDLHQTILFLRPMTKDATVGLNAAENDHYRFEVAPFKKPTDDKLVEKTPRSPTKARLPSTILLSAILPSMKDLVSRMPTITITLLLSDLALTQSKIHL